MLIFNVPFKGNLGRKVRKYTCLSIINKSDIHIIAWGILYSTLLLIIAYISIPKVSHSGGMDTINAAIHEMTTTVAREEWRTVAVAVAPSTVQVIVADTAISRGPSTVQVVTLSFITD